MNGAVTLILVVIFINTNFFREALSGAVHQSVQDFNEPERTSSQKQNVDCLGDSECQNDQICNRGQCLAPNATDVTTNEKPEATQTESPADVTTNEKPEPTQTESPADVTTNSVDTSLPKFKDYPSGPEYTGQAADLVLDNEFAKSTHTRLSEALAEKPVFAGEYVSATWGCGTSCTYTAFVNKRTGRVLDGMVGGKVGQHISAVRVDSNLLVAEGVVYDKDGNDTGEYNGYYYVLENEQLKLIKTNPIPRPEPYSN